MRRGAEKWHVEARDDTRYRHANTKAVNRLLALFGICCKLQMTLFWWRWGLTAVYEAYSSLSYPQHDSNHQNITVHGTLIKVRILSEVIFGHQAVTSTILEPVSYGDIFVLGSKTALPTSHWFCRDSYLPTGTVKNPTVRSHPNRFSLAIKTLALDPMIRQTAWPEQIVFCFCYLLFQPSLLSSLLHTTNTCIYLFPKFT